MTPTPEHGEIHEGVHRPQPPELETLVGGIQEELSEAVVLGEDVKATESLGEDVTIGEDVKATESLGEDVTIGEDVKVSETLTESVSLSVEAARQLTDDDSGNNRDLTAFGDPTAVAALDSKYGPDGADLDGNDGFERTDADFEALADEMGYLGLFRFDTIVGSDRDFIFWVSQSGGSGLGSLSLETDGTVQFHDNSGANVTSSLTVPTGELVSIVVRRSSTNRVQVHVWDATNGWREFINDDRGAVSTDGTCEFGIGFRSDLDILYIDGQVDHVELFTGSTTPSIATLKDRADPTTATGGTDDPNGNEFALYPFEDT